jgi:hypothetical protein
LARLLEQRGVTTAPLIVDGIRSAARQIRLIGDFFGKIVRRSGAKTGVLVDFSVISMGFNMACREAGIPSVELQHGVQGASHWAYARWNAVPPGGFSVLPSIYWNWSRSDALVINTWAHRTAGGHRAVAGGNLWLASWLRPGSERGTGYDARVDAALPRDELHILWTLQPGITGPRELGLLLQASDLSPPGWVWLPRLHPAMTAEERSTIETTLARLPASAAARTAANELPLPALLRRVDAHVTFSSSVTHEAAAMGVPTVLTGEEGVLYFADVVEQGWATPAAAVDAPAAVDVLAALEAAMATKAQPLETTPEDAAEVLRSIVGSGSQRG